MINTITSIIEKGKFESLNGMFALSLLLGISGAVTVLLNAPKSAPHGKPAEPKKPENDPVIASSAGTVSASADRQSDFNGSNESVKRSAGE